MQISPYIGIKSEKEERRYYGGKGYFRRSYRIHVVEVAWLSDKQVSMFTSDFGIVADFFVKKRKYGSNYKPSAKRIKHVDEVLKFLRVMKKDKRYEIRFSKEEQERGVSMCEIIDKYINDGRAEGLLEVAVNMIRKGLSDDYIQELTNITPDQLQTAREKALSAV